MLLQKYLNKRGKVGGLITLLNDLYVACSISTATPAL